jgi:hypothetical protein
LLHTLLHATTLPLVATRMLLHVTVLPPVAPHTLLHLTVFSSAAHPLAHVTTLSPVAAYMLHITLLSPVATHLLLHLTVFSTIACCNVHPIACTLSNLLLHTCCAISPSSLQSPAATCVLSPASCHMVSSVCALSAAPHRLRPPSFARPHVSAVARVLPPACHLTVTFRLLACVPLVYRPLACCPEVCVASSACQRSSRLLFASVPMLNREEDDRVCHGSHLLPSAGSGLLPRHSRRYGDNAQRMATLLAPTTGVGRVAFVPRSSTILGLCMPAFACCLIACCPASPACPRAHCSLAHRRLHPYCPALPACQRPLSPAASCCPVACMPASVSSATLSPAFLSSAAPSPATLWSVSPACQRSYRLLYASVPVVKA